MIVTSLIWKLIIGCSPALIESVCTYLNFFNVRNAITATFETLSSMLIHYLKGVSASLVIINCLRKYNTEIHHSHKKQIVWKHGPNGSFYALMLRAKLY